jgi:O-antigen/teichoic acid export membrane protein
VGASPSRRVSRHGLASAANRFRSSPSFFAYVDQGMVSAGNLLTQVILGRALMPRDYGAVTLLIGIVLLVRSLHFAVVVYPVTVWTATGFEEGTRRHTGLALGATVLWAVPGSVILAGACWILDRWEAWPLASIALLAGLLQETVRRALMARLRFRSAVGGDAVSFLGQAVLLFVALRFTHSIPVVFGVMALTSLLALGIQMFQLRPTRPVAVRRWLFESLGFGRWMLGTNLLQPITLQSFPWMLAGFHGTDATAGFQAVTTLLGVSNPVMATSSNLVVPIAARAKVEGEARVRRLVWRIGLQSFAILSPFFLVMLVVPTKLLRLVYGADSTYTSLGGEMRLLTLAYMTLLALNVLGNYFVGLGRSRSMFISQLWGVSIALSLGVALVWQLEVAGACLAFTATNVIQVGYLWRVYRSEIEFAAASPTST